MMLVEVDLWDHFLLVQLDTFGHILLHHSNLKRSSTAGIEGTREVFSTSTLLENWHPPLTMKRH